MPEVNYQDPVQVAALWSALVEPGDAAGGILTAHLGQARALEWLIESADPQALPDDLRFDEQGKQLPWKQAVNRWKPRLAEANVNRELEYLNRLQGELIYPTHPDWPAGFFDLAEYAPQALWVRGSGSLTQMKASISIVGARAATGQGEQIAAEFSYDLVRAGVTVVSGGAFGIDAAAHRGAITAAQQMAQTGLATIAFMAGGVGQLYPASQLDLFNRLMEVGVVVSEVPPGWRPARWRFLARNRLIAAFSQATLVVEAGVRSGALATARRALEIGRPVGAVPGMVSSQMSVGCHELIRDCNATLVTNTAQVRELLVGFDAVLAAQGNFIFEGGNSVSAESEFANPLEERVWMALPKRSDATVLSVAKAAGLSESEVNAALSGLLVAGKVTLFGDKCRRIY